MKKLSLYMSIVALFVISACQGNQNNNNNDRDTLSDPIQTESPYMDDTMQDTTQRDSLDSLGTPTPPMPTVPMD